jgi:hypothetical protein
MLEKTAAGGRGVRPIFSKKAYISKSYQNMLMSVHNPVSKRGPKSITLGHAVFHYTVRGSVGTNRACDCQDGTRGEYLERLGSRRRSGTKGRRDSTL